MIYKRKIIKKSMPAALLLVLIKLLVFNSIVFAVELNSKMSPYIVLNNKEVMLAFGLKMSREHVLEVLRANRWNQTAAARVLGTYHQKISKLLTPEDIEQGRIEERMFIVGALIRNKWDLSKAAANLEIGEKKIRRIFGQSLLDRGRARQRQKELDIEREMIFCALEAYRWNVMLVEKELGISKTRIYEVFPSQEVQRKRIRARDLQREKVIKVMEKHGWIIAYALKDQVLIEEEISKHKVYSLLGQPLIDENRKRYELKRAESEKDEIVKAISIFINSRNCLNEAAEYLGIPRGTLNDRLRKHNISFYDIKYSQDRVISVLLATGANLAESAKILKIDKTDLSKMFSKQIADIKNALKEKERIKRVGAIAGALREAGSDKIKAAESMGIRPETLRNWIKKHKVDEMPESERYLYWVKSRLLEIDAIIIRIKKRVIGIDQSNEEAVNVFAKSTEFIIYRCIKSLEEIEAESKDMDLHYSIKRQISRLLVFLREQYSLFGRQSENLITKQMLIKLLVKDVDNFKTEGRVFYSEYDMFLNGFKRFAEPANAEVFIHNSI